MIQIDILCISLWTLKMNNNIKIWNWTNCVYIELNFCWFLSNLKWILAYFCQLAKDNILSAIIWRYSLCNEVLSIHISNKQKRRSETYLLWYSPVKNNKECQMRCCKSYCWIFKFIHIVRYLSYVVCPLKLLILLKNLVLALNVHIHGLKCIIFRVIWNAQSYV